MIDVPFPHPTDYSRHTGVSLFLCRDRGGYGKPFFMFLLLGSPLDLAKAAETLYGVLCVFPSLCVCLQLYASLLVYLSNNIIDLV